MTGHFFRPGSARLAKRTPEPQEGGETDWMVKVSATGNEPLDKVLKRFKKKCEKEGLIRDIKRSSYYEKPSERRRRKLRKMIKRARKALAEQKAYYGY